MKKNIKIKKPEGGVLTNSSGAALPNSINQTGGNSGAAVVDPYSFSVQHGVTTLTPLQWKKLDAGQQQVIWRQAFDKAGFINTSEGNYLATKEQANMFSDGGQIFSQVSGAISPIVNMIPGVGRIINAGLSLANMGISMNQKEATVERAKEVLPMNQGIYGYKKGGNLAGRKKYFKGYEAEGEEIVLGNADINQTDKSSVGGIIKGASHKNGGVDGVGGEYIISDRWGVDGSYKEDNPNSLANAAAPIMKSIAKLEKRKGDNVDRLTLGLLKQKIGQFKQLNDKFLEQEQQEVMAKGGKLKYYEGGPNLVGEDYLNQIQNGAEFDMDWADPNSFNNSALDMFMQNPVVNSQTGFENTGYLNQSVAPPVVPETFSTYNKTGTNLVPDSYFKDAPKSMDTIEPVTSNANTRFSSHTGVNNGVTGAGGVQPRVAAVGRGNQIVPPINNDKLGGLTGLDYAGMGISALSSGLQIANTMKEYKRNKIENPNENFYSGVGDRAESTYRDSLNTLNSQKIQTARDINESFSPLLTTQQGNSINVDRAVKSNAYVQRMKGIGESNLNYDSAIASGKQGLAGLEFQNDKLNADGNFQVREAKQMDMANYFSSISGNIADATGQALTAIGIANKAKSQSQALMMLKEAYPNHTISEINGMLQILYK